MAMSVTDEKGLGKKLQTARQNARLTQQELCQRAGLSYSTLAKIERGAIKAPSVFTVQNIAGALGTSLDELIGTEQISTVQKPKQRSKSGITFVFFDVNGCLVRFFHRAFTRLAEETGVAPDIIETAFWHYNDAVCKGGMSVAAFNTALAKQLKVPHLNWRQYYLDAIDPIAEMSELVRWASEHYDIGLLTNIMPGFVSIMKKQGFIPDIHYSAIIDSSEVGCIKPEKKMYEIAQKAASRPSGEILLVDDSRSNLIPAERAGWHVLWFDDYNPSESVNRVRGALEPA